MSVVLCALLASFACAWTPPQARGPWAHGLRERVLAVYAGLETGAMRLRVDTARTPDSLRGPATAASWKIARDGGLRPAGTEVLRLEWTDSVGSVVRTDRVSARISREELVPMAIRRLFAGGNLDTADLRWEWRRTDGGAPPPPRCAEVHGRRLARGVGPGQELLSSALEPPTFFRRQERVRIVLSREGTRIVSDGFALEEGREGKIVRVKGPFGGEVRGRVMADTSVVVE